VTDDPIFLRINDLLHEQNKTQVQLINYLGMSRGTFTNWKKGMNRSYRFHLREIASFFHVTEAFIKEGTETAKGSVDENYCMLQSLLTEDESNLLFIYRKLEPDTKMLLSGIAQKLVI